MVLERSERLKRLVGPVADLIAGRVDGERGGVEEAVDAAHLEEALRWWREAAGAGVGLAAMRLGDEAMRAEDVVGATRWYTQAASAEPPAEGAREALGKLA